MAQPDPPVKRTIKKPQLHQMVPLSTKSGLWQGAGLWTFSSAASVDARPIAGAQVLRDNWSQGRLQ